MKKTFLYLSAISFILAFVLYVCLLGYKFSGIISAIFGAYFLFMALSSNTNSRFISFLRKFGTVCAIVGTLSMLTLCIIVGSEASGDPEKECDYVIVLGAGINGEEPSLTLSDRLLRTVSYMEKYPESIAIVSGSQGADELITEALAMERFLIERGIPKDRIIKEEAANNTKENMIYSLDIIEKKGGGTIAVISSDYHIFRARRLAESEGADPVMLSAKTTYISLFLNCILREAFALVKAYLIFI